jgi:hypothetical protein
MTLHRSSVFLAFKLLARFPFCGTNLTSHSHGLHRGEPRSGASRKRRNTAIGWSSALVRQLEIHGLSGGLSAKSDDFVV